VYDERDVQLLYTKAEINQYLKGFTKPNEVKAEPEVEEVEPNPQEKRLEQLVQQGRLKEVIFHLKNVPTNCLNRKKTYDLLFKALSNSEFHKEIPLLRTLFGRTGTLSSEEQVLLVSGLIERNDFSEALRQLDDLKQSNNAIPNWLDNLLVRKMLSSDPKRALEHFYSSSEKSPSFQPEFRTHDAILQHLAGQDLEKAEQYFQEISTRFDQTPDNHLYNILIISHVQKGDLNRAYEILRSMQNPIRPNLDSFQKLIEAYILQGNQGRVKKLQSVMKDKYKIQEDREFYHGLLGATVRRDPNDTKAIFGMLMSMRRAEFEPDVQAYNVIFRYAADAGVRRTVNKFFNDLKFRFFDVNEQVPVDLGQDMYPDADSYHLILSGYVKNNFLTQAYEFYRFMVAREVTPLPETLPLIEKILEHRNSSNSSDIVTPKE